MTGITVWNGKTWVRLANVPHDCDPETAAANAEIDAIAGYPPSLDAALKFNGKSWVADGAIPTRDVGDLLTEIDECCGGAIEKAAQRFLPRPEAKDVRRDLVRRIGDKVVAHDAKSNNQTKG